MVYCYTSILVGKNWHAPCRWWKRINFFCWVREHTLKTLLRPKENWQIGINWCTKEKSGRSFFTFFSLLIFHSFWHRFYKIESKEIVWIFTYCQLLRTLDTIQYCVIFWWNSMWINKIRGRETIKIWKKSDNAFFM